MLVWTQQGMLQPSSLGDRVERSDRVMVCHCPVSLQRKTLRVMCLCWERQCSALAARHLQRCAQLQVRRAAPAAARRLAGLVYVLVHEDRAVRARMHLRQVAALSV